jgi:hypothetical protein
MVLSEEIKCIEMARVARLRSAQGNLIVLEQGMPYSGPMSGIFGRKGDKSDPLTMKKILFFPIAIFLIGLLALMTPFDYIGERRKHAKRKSKLRAMIKELDAPVASPQVPTVKTIEALWNLHGLEDQNYWERSGFSQETRLDVLSKWVETLYGQETCLNTKLHERAADTLRRQAAANRPWYQGDPTAAHFHFVELVTGLVRDLSDELPPYGQRPTIDR